MAASNSYLLQTNVLVSGTLKITLYSSQAGLTIPKYNSLIVDSDFISRADKVNPGIQEIANVRCRYREDYSTYSNGFWGQVMTGEWNLRFTLNDTGASDDEFFWGEALPERQRLKEHYIGATTQREGEFELVSLMYRLSGVTVANLITEMASHLSWGDTSVLSVPGGVTRVAVIKFADVIASALKLALNTGSFASSDVTVRGNLDLECQENYGGMSWVQFNDFYMVVGYDPLGGTALTKWGYIDSGHANYWGNTYSTALNIIQMILTNFLLIGRYYYDVGAGRHKIEVMSRGNSFNVSTEQYAPIESTYMPVSDLLLRSAYATNRGGTKKFYYTNGGAIAAGAYPFPDGAELNINLDFDLVAAFSGSFHDYSIVAYYDTAAADDIGFMAGARVWIPSSAAYSSSYSSLPQAFMVYMYFRFFFFQPEAYEREYPTLKFTITGTSQTVLEVMRKCTISGNEFYATEVRKNVSTGRAFVRWEEV